MFITLTNASEGFAGEKIALNSEYVVSVYSKMIEKSSGVYENITYIHCPPHGTWEVSEDFDKVRKMLLDGQTI
jgi:hypothetical protein